MRQKRCIDLLSIIEEVDGNYSAYSPDIPGCVATGATREAAEERICARDRVPHQGAGGGWTPGLQRSVMTISGSSLPACRTMNTGLMLCGQGERSDSGEMYIL